MDAAIYVRQSLDRSGEALAVSRQLDECRRLAEQNGWQVAEVYSDNDTSATNGKPRPEWSRLLAALEAGRHDVLVCWHTDRLYRRVRDLVDLVELAERRALRIASVKSADIDLATPAGRLLAGMLGHAARYEVEQKGARQVAANRARANRGVVLWTRRPFGFDREGSTVFVVESEADAIRGAVDQVLKGASLASVARQWNEAGIRTTLGNKWTVTTVRRVMLNPRIGGRVTYKGEDMGALGPSILDGDTADHIRAKLTDPRRKTAASTVTKYLLSGLVKCGRCGAVMYASPVRAGNRRWMTYKCFTCRLARKLDDVDNVVTATVLARLARPDAAALLAPDVDLEALQGRAVGLRERRDALAAMLADGLLGPAEVRTQAQRLTTDLADLERQIDTATGSSPLSDIVGADDVAERWHSLSLRARRGIIDALLTARVLPVGKGAKFLPEHVAIDWRA